jgi:hypothetical protein
MEMSQRLGEASSVATKLSRASASMVTRGVEYSAQLSRTDSGVKRSVMSANAKTTFFETSIIGFART